MAATIAPTNRIHGLKAGLISNNRGGTGAGEDGVLSDEFHNSLDHNQKPVSEILLSSASRNSKKIKHGDALESQRIKD